MQNETLNTKLYICFLVVMAGLVLLPGLGRLTMLRQQELRVVMTAQDMARGGSWLYPEFRGELRLRKPPLMYWAVATPVAAFKGFGTPAIARLPSVAAAILLLVLVYGGLSRGGNHQPAFWASAILATSFLFSRFGRLADTDMMLTMLTTAAVLSGWQAMQLPSRESTFQWIIAGVCMGLGFMTKGPAAVALPITAWIVYALLPSIRTPGLRSWRPLLAVIILILLASSWYLLILTALREQAAGSTANEITETFGGTDHARPFYYYMYKLPAVMMPWGFLLPFAIWTGWKDRKAKPMTFVLTWWVTSFMILSFVPNKQEHYALLLLPSSAALVGWFCCKAIEHPASWRGVLIRVYLLLLLTLVGIAALGLMVSSRFNPSIANGPSVFFGSLLFLCALVGWRFFRHGNRLGYLLMTAMVCFTLLISTYTYVFHPLHRPESLIKNFSAEIQEQLNRTASIYGYGHNTASLEYYLDSRVLDIENPVIAWETLAPGAALIITGDRKHPLPALPSAEPVLYESWRDYRALLFIKPVIQESTQE